MKALLCCTKQKPKLMKSCRGKYGIEKDFKYITDNAIIFNGKIVAECDYKMEALKRIGKNDIRSALVEDSEWLNHEYYEYKSCLSEEELFNYVKDKFYAIHLSNVNIFEEPTLSYTVDKDYIIIKCSPKELCNILNGKQTILIRKRVSKKMIDFMKKLFEKNEE